MNKLNNGQGRRHRLLSGGEREGGGGIGPKQGLHLEFNIGGDGFSTLGGRHPATTYPNYPQFRFVLGFRPLYLRKVVQIFFLIVKNVKNR